MKPGRNSRQRGGEQSRVSLLACSAHVTPAVGWTSTGTGSEGARSSGGGGGVDSASVYLLSFTYVPFTHLLNVNLPLAGGDSDLLLYFLLLK